jgi:TRAP-type mannitol/chloroaromatic compound transport system substrate-binding protein
MGGSLFAPSSLANHPNRTISLATSRPTIEADERRVMKLLIALLALASAALAAYRWKNPKAVNSVWANATDLTSSFTKDLADKATQATDKAADTASTAADEIKGAVAD